MNIRDFLKNVFYVSVAATLIGTAVPVFSGCSEKPKKPSVQLEEVVEEAPAHVEPSKVKCFLDIPLLKVKEVKVNFPDVTGRIEVSESYKYCKLGDGSSFGEKIKSDNGLGCIFYSRAKDKRSFSLCSEDTVLTQDFLSQYNDRHHRSLRVLDEELILTDDFVKFKIVADSIYSGKKHESFVVLADIKQGRKFIFYSDPKFVNLEDKELIILKCDSEDVLISSKDLGVVFYHPGEKISCFSPNMEKIVLRRSGKNSGYHLYDLTDKTEVEFWNSRNINDSNVSTSVSNNGRFFAIQKWSFYLKNRGAASGGSWASGLFPVMTNNDIEVYDVKGKKSVKFDIIDYVPRAVPLNGVDDSGNLKTAIGLLRFNGARYSFEPTQEEIERQKHRGPFN